MSMNYPGQRLKGYFNDLHKAIWHNSTKTHNAKQAEKSSDKEVICTVLSVRTLNCNTLVHQLECVIEYEIATALRYNWSVHYEDIHHHYTVMIVTSC